MNRHNLASPLRQFIDQVTTLIEEDSVEESFLPLIGDSMKALVSSDTWLNPEYAREHPEHYQQYLLYADPRDRFSVVSFVWGPGQKTPIHDHTVWGVIGMLRGSEFEQGYEIKADGDLLSTKDEIQLFPGDVGFVSLSCGDVHQVRNAYQDQVSISIHAYGGNIGKISRHIYPANGEPRKDFISGYANAAD